MLQRLTLSGNNLSGRTQDTGMSLQQALAQRWSYYPYECWGCQAFSILNLLTRSTVRTLSYCMSKEKFISLTVV